MIERSVPLISLDAVTPVTVVPAADTFRVRLTDEACLTDVSLLEAMDRAPKCETDFLFCFNSTIHEP